MQSYKKIIFVFLIAALVAGIFAYSAISYFDISERIVMINDNVQNVSPFNLTKIVGQSGVLKDNTITKDDANKNIKETEKLKMFGTIDINDIKKKVDTNKKLIPCGNSIGVKLFADGILVVGLSEFEGENGKKEAPAKRCGIRVGDVIKKVNGKTATDADKFIKECENSKKIKLEVLRNNKIYEFEIESKISKSDGKNKLGLWVRDSTAGIGTMTFYDPHTKTFGALGHGITDIDTGDIMPIKEGSIVMSNIVSSKKGEKGSPGELQGIFLESRGEIGKVLKNTSFGIYGALNNDNMLTNNDSIFVASREEVEEGRAYILSNIEGQKVKDYEIEIQKTFSQNTSSTKGMIIKITDEELIKKTGGIVQGMSGSPIIQNGKLIGAVTHVFVNDPTRGYGIFIENMLAEAEKIK